MEEEEDRRARLVKGAMRKGGAAGGPRCWWLEHWMASMQLGKASPPPWGGLKTQREKMRLASDFSILGGCCLGQGTCLLATRVIAPPVKSSLSDTEMNRASPGVDLEGLGSRPAQGTIRQSLQMHVTWPPQ